MSQLRIASGAFLPASARGQEAPLASRPAKADGLERARWRSVEGKTIVW